MINGYTEADKIDKQIMEIYNKSKVGKPPVDATSEQKLDWNTRWEREITKFLRTVETTCDILQIDLGVRK